jgi:quercetin dioxygenase-like cupin family protein
MAHTVIDANDVETPNGVFRGLSAPLGVGTFKVNRLELPPGGEGPEHDHASNGEEEVYAVVGGSGTVVVDGEEIAIRPGNFVFCSPDARRQMRAGADGLVWIAIGATGEKIRAA